MTEDFSALGVQSSSLELTSSDNSIFPALVDVHPRAVSIACTGTDVEFSLSC